MGHFVWLQLDLLIQTEENAILLQKTLVYATWISLFGLISCIHCNGRWIKQGRFSCLFQVKFIYITQYHKSQFTSRGFTIWQQQTTPSVLRSLNWMRKTPQKTLSQGKNERNLRKSNRGGSLSQDRQTCNIQLLRLQNRLTTKLQFIQLWWQKCRL